MTQLTKINLIFVASTLVEGMLGQHFHQPRDFQQKPHDHHHQVLHNDINLEREHVKEHLEVPVDINKMSEDELTFHYFKMLDVDKNSHLDGQELISSIIHATAHGHIHDGQIISDERAFSDEEFSEQIDPVLNTDDLNKDGYISYP